MIYVDGAPFSTHSFSSKGSKTLLALMEHPILISVSDSFKAIPERKFPVSEESCSERSTQSKCVYVFQREYATVDPALVDVHLIGGFEDASPKVWPETASPKHANHSTRSERHAKLDGYSFPLCSKIVQTLRERREKFHIRTLFVLGHNTRRDRKGVSYPIFNGLLVETSTGSVIPASFDRTVRCPDEIVRRIRVTASFEDCSWKGKLLETYDSLSDQFKIASCSWTQRKVNMAMKLQHLSDSEILLICSTSPSAEGPHFVDDMRRQWDYLIKHPNWEETFPMKQPRVFERTADGGWRRC